jgi:hypothetical protein
MEYDLLKNRGLQPNQDLESMKLLYFYGKYKKEREAANLANQNPNVTKAY